MILCKTAVSRVNAQLVPMRFIGIVRPAKLSQDRRRGDNWYNAEQYGLKTFNT
jgi:hypothetical protein